MDQFLASCKTGFFSWLFLLASLVSACASITKPAGSDLQASVKGFQHDIRWRYYDSAASAVDPSQSSAFLDLLDAAKEKLNVIDWEIRGVELSVDLKEAKVSVRIQYYWLPSTVIQEQTVKQAWKLINSRWVLVSQQGGPLCFPLCGEELKDLKNTRLREDYNPGTTMDEHD